MISSKTVFIVGAGASSEVGLPVGRALKAIIASKLDLRFEHLSTPVGTGDLSIFEELRSKFGSEVNRLLHACWQVRDGVELCASIDDFIDTHRDDSEIAICAKLAIFRSILEAERGSRLHYDRSNIYNTISFGALDGTWYKKFFELLRVPKADLDNIFKNVTIVTFNYDRCIEHYLAHAIPRHYGVPREEAAELIKQLVIYRPYGSVGSYFGPGQVIEFGVPVRPRLEQVAKSLRTYTEQIEDQANLRKIRDAVVNAPTIVFLGTAFHDANMHLLCPEENCANAKRIFYTRKGISDANLQAVNRQLIRLHGPKPNLGEPADRYFFPIEECHQLFDEFSRLLRQ